MLGSSVTEVVHLLVNRSGEIAVLRSGMQGTVFHLSLQSVTSDAELHDSAADELMQEYCRRLPASIIQKKILYFE